MKIDEEKVKKIAHLARLRLTDEETVQMSAQLSSILTYVEKLGELDTKNIEPLASPVAAKTPFRKDQVAADFPRALVTANAPEAEQGMFRVPPVIE